MLYKAYGKVIWSDISFTQLLVEEEKTESELEIKIAKIDEDMKSYIEAHKGPGGKGDGFCWINTPGGYFVVRGNQILTESNTEEQHEKMRSYILGYGLSLLFYNLGMVAVHCSAIENQGQALLISGFSGAGKSTLAGAFLDRGWKLLSDDVAMVEKREDKLFTSPAFPVRKLCRDAALRSGYELDDLTYIDEDKDKFAVNCMDVFAKEETAVRAMITVTPYDGDDVKIEKVTGLDKIDIFMKNQFLRVLFSQMGIEPENFFEMMQMLSVLPIYRIFRPVSDPDSTGKMIQTIMDRIG